MPAGTVDWFSWNSPWLKWPWAPAGPQARRAQYFMESMIITLAKLGSRGRQSKVNQWWPQELPVWGYSPRSPQGAARLGWAHNSTCVHRDLGAQGRRVQPQSPQQWQCFPASLSHSLGTDKSSAALLIGPCTPQGLGGIFPGRNALPPLLGFMTSYMRFGVLRFEGATDHYAVLPADIPHSFGKWMLQEYFPLQTLEPKSSLLQLLCKLSNHSAGF